MKPMTRSKGTLIIFILVIVVVAWVTNPGMESFKTHFSKTADPKSPPIIQQVDYKFYSIYNVTYYEAKQIPQQTADGQPATIAVPGKTEKYVGLFTRFIKL